MNPVDHARPPSAVLARAEGALLGVAAGDASGWPQEMPRRSGAAAGQRPTAILRDWKRRGGGQYYPFEETIGAGEYSDDTQLTLALARSLTQFGAHWWVHFTTVELPLWTLYERGGGGATKRAADAWASGVAPWRQKKPPDVTRYFDAGGNGVAMRVIPHAIAHCGDTEPQAMLRDVTSDGVATHGHPRAVIGGRAFAYGAWSLLRTEGTLGYGALIDAVSDAADAWGALPVGGPSRADWLENAERATGGAYVRVWHDTVAETLQLLGDARKALHEGVLADDASTLERLGAFGRAKGSGTVTTVGALYLAARHAAEPTRGVLQAAFAAGADTDTLAAMVGGLLGCLCGTEWMPIGWLHVQDAPYIRRIAGDLVARPTGEPSPNAEIEPLRRSSLDAFRGMVEAGAVPPLACRLFGSEGSPIPSTVRSLSAKTRAAGWRLPALGGQTVFLTRVGREAAGPTSGDPTGERASTAALAAEVAVSPGSTGHRPAEVVPRNVVAVEFRVSDPKDTADFLVDVLGVGPVRKASAGVLVGPLLLTPIGPKPNPHQRGGADEPTSRLRVAAADVDSVVERLRARGVAFSDVAGDSERRLEFDAPGGLPVVVSRWR